MSEVHLLLGPESGAKEQELKQIRSRLIQQHGDGVELIRFYPFECEGGELSQALSNASLFSDHRLVILSRADEANAALVAEIVAYLAHPSASATLIIISEEFSISAKVMRLIPKERTKIFYDLLEGQKAEWIRSYFRRMGIMITADALDLLIDLSEDNTQELRTICSQLGLFWQIADKDRPIEEEDVQTYVFHSRQEDAFTLFPLIARRDLRQSLRSLSVILGSGDSQTPILLLRGLLWQFRRLNSVSEELASGGTESQAFAQARVLTRSTPIRSPRDKTTYRNAVRHYSHEQIRAIIVTLSDTDMAIKEAGGEMTHLLFERLLYRIIQTKGKKPHPPAWAAF
jgi:DNA polymerase-3 subunit delta